MLKPTQNQPRARLIWCRRFPVLVGITTALLMLAARGPLALTPAQAASASQEIATLGHDVPHVSTAPGIAGQPVQLYVRERVQDGARRTAEAAGPVVLIVHGLTYPSAPVFDIGYQDYSWMAHLAQAGFDVFAMDLTGYGPSTRPAPMDDPCNVNPDQQAVLIPHPLSEPCPPQNRSSVTSLQSDWDDIDAVVDYLRALRQVERVNLVGWSLGGPRVGGYAALHPEKVDKMVLLAPVYKRQSPTELPAGAEEPGFATLLATRQGAFAGWDSQIRCEDQFDPGIRDLIWAMNMEFDPVGATWGPGVVRAPTRTLHPLGWGWNPALAAKVQAPTLLVTGELDETVPPQDVRDLYADLGAPRKALLEMACSSHFVTWETRHTMLYDASVAWLLHGTINGTSEGALRASAVIEPTAPAQRVPAAAAPAPVQIPRAR